MKNKTIKLLIIILAISVVVALPISAATEIYVNNGELLPAGLDVSYAIGSDGVLQLGKTSAHILSSRGVHEIGATLEEMYPGGGGLVSVGDPISINFDTVKVGLAYYYSDARNTAVSVARLENAVGRGYGFGYFDENRRFVELASTETNHLTIKIIEGSAIAVYSTADNVEVYRMDYTDKNNYLGIMPKADEGVDPITWFSGNKYFGGFEYAVLGGGKITVVNVVDLEKYVMGVCSREMSESWPLEALKTQAVAARTFVGNSIGKSTYFSKCGFDVTGDTYSQAYSGCNLVGENITSAALQTAGEYLTYNGTLCNAVYSSSSGGATEDAANVFGGQTPYLKGVIDPYEAACNDINSRSEWKVVYTPSQIAKIFGLNDVVRLEAEYSLIDGRESGNVIKLTAFSSAGSSKTIQRDACRTSMGLNSIHYTVSKNSYGNYVFTGSGWGHNVGMSQFGAYAMAKHYSKTYQDILGFYYTGVSLSYADYGNEEISNEEIRF